MTYEAVDVSGSCSGKTSKHKPHEYDSEQTDSFIASLTDMYRQRITQQFNKLLEYGYESAKAAALLYRVECKLIKSGHDMLLHISE